MFGILGAEQIIGALAKDAPQGSWLHALKQQFTHAEWAGFRFYDFIFPLFLFAIGVAVPLSLDKRLSRGESRARILHHALMRFAWMVFFGWWVTGNFLSWDFAKMHLSYSVLMMLGLGYLIAVALVLFTSLRAQIVATAAMLIGYWALQMFVPVPGHVAGEFKEGAILSDWLYDHSVGLLGAPWKSQYGRGFVLTFVTHGATAMLGVFAARILKAAWSEPKKLKWLIVLGVGCLIAGWLWSFHFPIVKRRWTSSYVLWAGGWSYLLMAAFYWIIDVNGLRRWAGLFVVIGSNSILAYLIAGVFFKPFRTLAEVLFGGLRTPLGEYWAGVVLALASCGFAWLLLAYLHRRRIFLRL
jgi:predicted acyltransferase